MELITLGIGLIVKTCVKNKEAHVAINNFAVESLKWIRGWFGKSKKSELLEKLEANPNSEEAQVELSNAMTDLSSNQQFMKELERWIKESKNPNPSMKNVLEDIDIEVKGNIRIGDKEKSDQKHDLKNVIKKGKIIGGGDFTLGDG